MINIYNIIKLHQQTYHEHVIRKPFWFNKEATNMYRYMYNDSKYHHIHYTCNITPLKPTSQQANQWKWEPATAVCAQTRQSHWWKMTGSNIMTKNWHWQLLLDSLILDWFNAQPDLRVKFLISKEVTNKSGNISTPCLQLSSSLTHDR